MTRKMLRIATLWLRKYTLYLGFNHATTFGAADMMRAYAAGYKAGRAE